MNGESRRLSATEAAELLLLKKAAEAGRIAFGTPQWDRYLDLVAKDDGATREPAAQVPVRRFKTRDEIAEFYGAKRRTVEEWITIGRAAGAEPPFEHPLAMVQWWERYRKQRVPAGIMSRAAEAETAPSGAMDNPDDPSDADEQDTPRLQAGVDLSGAGDFDAILHDFATTTAGLLRDYRASAGRGDFTRAALLRKEIDSMGGHHRQWEKNLSGVRASRDTYLSRDEVSEAWSTHVSAIPRALVPALHRESYLRIAEYCRLQGIAPPEEQAHQQWMRAAVDAAFAGLPETLPAELRMMNTISAAA